MIMKVVQPPKKHTHMLRVSHRRRMLVLNLKQNKVVSVLPGFGVGQPTWLIRVWNPAQGGKQQLEPVFTESVRILSDSA